MNVCTEEQDMKPSHRKDVIIARIIFVVFCVIVIAIVSGIIVSVVNHFKVNTQPETQATESEQTVDQLPPNVCKYRLHCRNRNRL